MTVGRQPHRFAEHEQTLPVEPWLAQSQTPPHVAEEIRHALRAEADGGPATGLRAARADDGQLTITHRWVLIGS